MLEEEALLVIERQNAMVVTETTLLQMAVASILEKKAGKALDKRLKKLSIEVQPRSIENEGDEVQWPPPDYVESDNGWKPPEVEE